MILRDYKKSDILSVVTLMRDSFSEDIIEKTIYGSSKISNFISDNFKEFCFILEIENKIVGYIEYIKYNNNQLFLNYIVVKNVGIKGLGKKILLDSLERIAEIYDYKYIYLDVFFNNDKARKWYEKLGFKKEKEFYWNSFEVTKKNYSDNYTLINEEDSEIHLEKYGITQYKIFSFKENKIYNFGYLDNGIVRIYDVESLKNKAIFEFFSYIKNIKYFWYMSDTYTKYFFLKNIRMSIEKESLITRLKKGVKDDN